MAKWCQVNCVVSTAAIHHISQSHRASSTHALNRQCDFHSLNGAKNIMFPSEMQCGDAQNQNPES